MARKLEVEILASTAQYTRGLVKAGEQTKLFAREVEASSAHIGRSLAFATGGFVAFAGAAEFLKTSIDVARDAGVAQRQLGAQLKASGDSFAANQAAIGKAELSLEKFGFTSEDSAKALTVLERGTGRISRAIQLQGVAANLARAKNLDLASAANVLAKVFGGQETALRRAVPGLDKHAHGLELIAQAQQKLSGQAAAGTTVAERFSATLHDTEVIVGTALLPTLNKFLTSLGDWLQKMNESGKLQKDVNEAVKTGTGIFQGVLDVVKPLVGAFKALGDAVGGTRNEVKLLLGAFLAFKTARLVTSLETVGGAAAASAGQVRGLRGALLGLTRVGLITIPIEILLNKGAIDKGVSGFLNRHGLPGGTPQLSTQQVFSQYGKIKAAVGADAANKFLAMARRQMGITSPSGQQYGPPVPAGLGSAPSIAGLPTGVHGAGIANQALTAGQQRAIGLAGDPNNLGLLRQQAAGDRAALEFAKKLRAQNRITNAKYVQEVTGYASDLQQTNSTIAGILETARQKAADAAKTAADNAKKAAQAAKDRAAAAQQAVFDRLQFNVDKTGLTASLQDDLKALQKYQAVLKNIIATQGSTLALQQQLLGVEQGIQSVQGQITDRRKQAAADAKAAAQQHADAVKQARQAAIEKKAGWLDFAAERADATKTIKDDVRAQQAIIKFLQTRLKHEGRTLELVKGIWEARQKIRDLKKTDVDPLAGLTQVSSKQLASILAAGTGLGARGRGILGANIAGAEIQPLHVHVNIDGREIGRAVTRDQARTSRRTAKQTSGLR